MTSVQIKGVPEQTHAVLRERAARAHQSLPEYLLGLVREASAPTLDEVLDRAAGRSAGVLTYSESVAGLQDDRDRR